jgi:hypothetical protein
VVFLSATLVAILAFSLLAFVLPFAFWLLAGIREFVAVLQALPLCGAAPTFLCSGKEK